MSSVSMSEDNKINQNTLSENEQAAVDVLSKKGKVSHEELTTQLGFSSEHDTQKVVKDLWSRGVVTVTVDREYKLKD